MNYYLLALLWLLGIEGHASEWSHYNHHRWMAVFWPVFAGLSALLIILRPVYWLWVNRPRWRWRVTWVRTSSVRHWGWTTKDGKLVGLIKIVKIFGVADKDRWVFSGIAFDRWAIGTVTGPEFKK